MSPASLLKISSLALVAATWPAAASANLTANLALTSNYKFRGQDQDVHRVRGLSPALQGGLDYAFGASGFYVGNWNSSVDWLAGNALESDLYGGYKSKVGGVDLDLGALAYLYSGNKSGNTTELYAAASWGALTARYAHTVSKDYFGWAGAASSGQRGRHTGYLSLAWTQELRPGLALKASLGYTRFAGDIKAQGVPGYLDYSLGGGHDFGGGLSLSAAVAGASRQGYFGAVNKPRLLLTLAKTI